MTTFTNPHQKVAWSRTSTQAIVSYLNTHEVGKLQLGSGTNVLAGWFNTDVVPASPDVFYLDSSRRFPIEDAAFDYVFSEHHIEHLTYNEGLFTLQECYRILKPGGTLRLVTPDLNVLLSLYNQPLDDRQKYYIQFIAKMFLPDIRTPNPIFIINNAFYNWGHRFLYDHATLLHALESIGFMGIRTSLPGESTDPQLRNLEKHGQFIGDEAINQFESMVLEGKRPPLSDM